MASAGINVLRYSAFFGGIGYGFSHQRSIYKKEEVYKAEQDQKHQEDLLHKAKEEWAKKLNPPPKTSGVIDDPEDPKFDLEAYLNEKSKETK